MPKLGYISCSQLSKLMVATDLKKGDFGGTAMTYAYQLAAERLGVTDWPEAHSRSMEWGIDNEGLAARQYEIDHFVTLESCVFMEHPTIRNFGGTPDRRVGRKVIEIKCPDPQNHIKNLHNGAQYYSDYKPQVQGYLLFPDFDEADFVSFDPRFPDEYQMGVLTVKPDKEYQAVLTERIIQFDKVVNDLVEAIKNK